MPAKVNDKHSECILPCLKQKKHRMWLMNKWIRGKYYKSSKKSKSYDQLNFTIDRYWCCPALHEKQSECILSNLKKKKKYMWLIYKEIRGKYYKYNSNKTNKK